MSGAELELGLREGDLLRSDPSGLPVGDGLRGEQGTYSTQVEAWWCWADLHRQVSSGPVCDRHRSEEGTRSIHPWIVTGSRSPKDACLEKNDLRPSMDLVRELMNAGIEGLVFTSVVGRRRQSDCLPRNCGRKARSIQNEGEVIDQVRRITGRHK